VNSIEKKMIGAILIDEKSKSHEFNGEKGNYEKLEQAEIGKGSFATVNVTLTLK
jgi:hypothetical protein